MLSSKVLHFQENVFQKPQKSLENSEQLESALSEMAAQLENAKIDHDDMKDLHESLTGHKWVDEKTVKICYKCERDFTIKRRKVKLHAIPDFVDFWTSDRIRYLWTADWTIVPGRNGRRTYL